MKTFKKHNQETGRTEAITFDGQPCFTTRSELVTGRELVASATFAAGEALTRTFILNFYTPKGISSVEGGDNDQITTHQVFSSQSLASRTYESLVAQYDVDSRWTRIS